MKTKEELLFVTPTIEHNGTTWHSNNGTKRVMDEYAKESSLDFAKWLNDNCIVATGGQWRHHKKWIPIKNTDELYEMYQQEKSSSK